MTQPPSIITVSLNGDVILADLKELLRDVQVSITRLATTAELSINETLGNINQQVMSVSGDIKTISSNISLSSAGLPDPWIILLIELIIIVILCVLVVFLLLRTRRELKLHPIRIRRKRKETVYEAVNGQLFIPEDVGVVSDSRPSTNLKIITDV